MLLDHEREYNSRWAAIKSISEKIGCTAETLCKWVHQAERDSGKPPGLTMGERERLKAMEKENQWLKRALANLTLDNLILKQAAKGNL